MKNKLPIVSFVAALVTMGIGIFVMIGWFIHNDFMRMLVPGQVKMKFNVASGFVLSSIVLLLYHFREKNKIWSYVSILLSVIVSLIGLLTLAEYIFGINIGIDEFFVKDELRTTAIYYAGRMSPLSAINLLLIGIGLLLLNKEKAAAFQFFYLFGIAFVSLLMLISFNFIADIPTYIGLAIHVAIGFITLSIAIWFAQPELQAKISFERKLFTGFIAIIILIVLLSVFSSYYSDKRISTSRLVEHTNNILSEAGQTLSLTKDIESGGRGYIITGDSDYLEYFTIAKNNIFSHVKKLKELTADNPAQQVRIDSLSALITKRIDFSLQCIQLTNDKGFEAARALMDTRMGKFYTDKIRKVTSAIQQEENDLLIQRQKENNKSIVSFNRAFFIFLGCVFILLVIILFSIRNNFAFRRKAEKQIKESEEQIQTIFRAAPDAVVVIDSEGKITKWNSMSETLFGWSADEVLGKPLSETIIPHRYREAHKKGMKHFLKTGEGPVLGKAIEIQALNKNNIEFDVALSISPTIVNEKHVFIGFIRDITERKKAEEKLKESEEKFQKTFQASAAGISITRLSNATYLDVNDAFVKMTGYAKEELIGHTSVEQGMIINFERREKILQQIREHGSVKNFEITVRNKSGKMLEVLTSVETILLNGEKYAINIIYDITERKKAERELEAVNEELEAFTYSVSHDLRAPLRGIIGFIAMLEEDYSSKLDDEAKRITSVIKDNTLRMGLLIDDLLAFSRMGKQEILKTRIDTQIMVKEMIDGLVQQNKELVISWDIRPLPPVNADINTIRQVWINLISNAIKYSGNKENQRIEIGAFNQEGQTAFFIKDNGVGFDEQYKSKLFKVFQRLHSTEEFEGTGVGLALVEKIVSKHGGKVWAEGEVNKGAIFYFSLPAEDIEQKQKSLYHES